MKGDPLTPRARGCSALLGIILVVVALVGVVLPFPTAYEWAATGAALKSARNVSDIASLATACLLAGIALLVYAINGVRLLRFGFGPVVADASSAAEYAKDYYREPQPEESERIVEVEDKVPGETNPPIEELRSGDDQLAIFALDDVPSRVIADAFKNWPPSAGREPSSLGEFEFAARRRGKGNNAWTLKFRDRSPVRVSYGGRGKQDATTSKE